MTKPNVKFECSVCLNEYTVREEETKCYTCSKYTCRRCTLNMTLTTGYFSCPLCRAGGVHHFEVGFIIPHDSVAKWLDDSPCSFPIFLVLFGEIEMVIIRVIDSERVSINLKLRDEECGSYLVCTHLPPPFEKGRMFSLSRRESSHGLDSSDMSVIYNNIYTKHNTFRLLAYQLFKRLRTPNKYEELEHI